MCKNRKISQFEPSRLVCTLVKYIRYQSIIVYIGDYLHERVFGQVAVDISIRFWQIFMLHIPVDYVSIIIMFITLGVIIYIKSRAFNKIAADGLRS